MIFFLYTTKDSFQQKIYFDKVFWLVNKCKLEIFYSKFVLELLSRNFNTIKFYTEIHIKLFFNIPFEKFQWYRLVIYFYLPEVPQVFAFLREESSKTLPLYQKK